MLCLTCTIVSHAQCELNLNQSQVKQIQKGRVVETTIQSTGDTCLTFSDRGPTYYTEVYKFDHNTGKCNLELIIPSDITLTQAYSKHLDTDKKFLKKAGATWNLLYDNTLVRVDRRYISEFQKEGFFYSLVSD